VNLKVTQPVLLTTMSERSRHAADKTLQSLLAATPNSPTFSSMILKGDGQPVPVHHLPASRSIVINWSTYNALSDDMLITAIMVCDEIYPDLS